MDSSTIVNIIVLIVLLVLSGLFSCSETAFLAVSKIKIRNQAEDGNKNAILVEKLLEDKRLFTSILVGNNIVNIGASSITTATMIAIFGDGASYIAYATGIMTLLILIFGEITPKSLAKQNANKLVLFLAKPIRFVVWILTPVVFILNIITSALIHVLGGTPDNQPTITEEELKTIVTVGHEEGVIEDEEKEMIHNVFEFGDTEIREIMTPRINVDMLSDECTYNDLMETYHKGQYSRYPVFSESYDDIIGVLNIKDLLFFNIDPEKFSIKDYMRDDFVVYEFNQVSDVFESMRKQHATLAIVLDEYGAMSGIVTFEDIVEEIVGEIDDEYDEYNKQINKLSANVFLVDGSMNINEVNDELDLDIDNEDFESIGGLVLGEFSGVPNVNDRIDIDNVTYIITKMHKNRIAQLKMIINESDDKKEKEED
ncbi:MAG: hemolysin family protein [Thomasclavelia sp.]|nr:hemolysin family protein [Thomasclavelia sp.]